MRKDSKNNSRKTNYKKAGICIGMAAVLTCTVFTWGGLSDKKTGFSDQTGTDSNKTSIHTYDIEDLPSEDTRENTIRIHGDSYTVSELSGDAAHNKESDDLMNRSEASIDTGDASTQSEQNIQSEYALNAKIKEVDDASDVVALINDTWEEPEKQDSAELADAEDKNIQKEKTDDTYQLKRLMVLTDGRKLTDDYGASEILHYGKYNEYVLQFETEADTKYAYYELVSDYGKDNCYIDQVVTDEVLATFTGVTDYKTMSWGGSYMGMGYLKAEYDYYQVDRDVTVALIDTGLDTTNKIFNNRVDKRRSFYFKGSDSVKKTTAYVDENGHGTHVAGIIADNTPDNVNFMVLKAFDGDGKSSNLAIRSALQYAVDQKADVVNMSFGWTGMLWAYSSYLKDVLKKAETAGTVVCCAAGNKASDVAMTYPANKENVITVSAIRNNGMFASDYSNYGDMIDFAAPGTAVVSTYLGGGKKSMSGTSMATPHVVAAIAYIKMIEPKLNYKGVKNRLKQYAEDRGTLGWDEKYGWGVIKLHDYFDDMGLDTRYTDYDADGTEKDMPEISFTKKKLTKKYGNADYKYEVTTNSTGKVVYRSSNTAVAEPDQFGYITIKKAGSCTITARVAADANYKSASAGYQLVVSKKDMTKKKVKLSKTSYIYAGKNCKPKAVVSGLARSDYKVTYKNADKPGTAICVITGKGNYSGKIEVPYSINLAKTVITKITNKKSGVSLTWKKVAGAKGYRIYRRTKNGSWKRIRELTSSKKVSFTDKTAKSGKTYEYRVRAKCNKTYGSYSKKIKLKKK